MLTPSGRLKKIGAQLKHIKKINKRKYHRFNLYFEDESRFGLQTRTTRVLTARGIKPVCSFQHRFDNLYLFGAFSPITGSSLLLELPECNTDMFQLFLNELSDQDKTEFKIMILDNGAFHKAKRLVIPDNIALLFLPPYSPELNPAEKVWWILKKAVSMKVFKSIDDLSEKLEQIIGHLLTIPKLKSLTGYDFYKQKFMEYF